MIDEALIERGLRVAGDRYDIPAGGFDEIRAQWTVPSRDDQPRRGGLARLRQLEHRGRWITAAAVLVIGFGIGIPVAIGSSGQTFSPALGIGPAGGSSSGSSSVSQKGVVPAQANNHTGNAVTGGTGGSSSAGSVSEGPEMTVPVIAPPAAAASATPQSVTSGGGSVAGSSTPTTPDRVVKTGQIFLRTKAADVTSTISQITQLASRDGGFVQSSHTTASTATPSGQITLRVPAGRFTSLISSTSHLTDAKVTSLTTSGRDVTAQYVDLSARLKALDQLRSTYLTILSHAHTIGATLAVEDRINDTQTQIEQLTGQRKLLANQSALSTLTVNVSSTAVKALTNKPKHRSGFSKAVHTSVRRFVHGVENIIGIIGPIALVLLVIAVLLGLGLGSWRLIRRRMV